MVSIRYTRRSVCRYSVPELWLIFAGHHDCKLFYSWKKICTFSSKTELNRIIEKKKIPACSKRNRMTRNMVGLSSSRVDDQTRRGRTFQEHRARFYNHIVDTFIIETLRIFIELSEHFVNRKNLIWNEINQELWPSFKFFTPSVVSLLISSNLR